MMAVQLVPPFVVRYTLPGCSGIDYIGVCGVDCDGGYPTRDGCGRTCLAVGIGAGLIEDQAALIRLFS